MVTAVHVYNLYIFIYLLEGKGPCPNIYIFLGAYVFKFGSSGFRPAFHKRGHTQL